MKQILRTCGPHGQTSSPWHTAHAQSIVTLNGLQPSLTHWIYITWWEKDHFQFENLFLFRLVVVVSYVNDRSCQPCGRSHLCECRCWFFGVWRRVDLYVDTNVSEEHTASISGCNAVWTCTWIQTFQRNILPPYLVVTPCGLVGRYQHFSPEDGGSMSFRNVGIYLQVHITQQPRKPISIR
jgi:hypothetical protein